MIDIEDIKLFVFDFDGVLTNNKVITSSSGEELVVCSRSDGVAFDALRALNKKTIILSTEANPVVDARARKLKVRSILGCEDKAHELGKILSQENILSNEVMYIGNDINDYKAMSRCGFSACPADSHDYIKEISTVVLESKGGEGVVRELIENVLKINLLEVLYQL